VGVLPGAVFFYAGAFRMTKVAFIFPGQASQFVGMGRDFYESSALARQYYDLAETRLGFPLKKFSFEGPLSELTETRITQPAIFVLSCIIFFELKARGYRPDMVAGHSLGEYSALVACGALTFEDGLDLVKIRAEQMQIASEQKPGTMAAIVGLDYDQVKKIISESNYSGVCQIANCNSPAQIVISGDVYKVQSLMTDLKEAGAKMVVELSVGGAFHSDLMQPASEALKEALSKTEFKTPDCPIYSNVTATATRDPQEIRNRLYQQLTSPVLWTDTIRNMIADGAEIFVEVGPGKVLQGLVKRTSSDVKVLGVSKFNELEQIAWN